MTDLTRLWHFNRPKLATSLVDRALAQERVALFGPRQTGKTSLLREEVMPLAAKRGALAIYIECWADKTDPLGSINYGLQKAIDDLTVPSAGAARALKTPVRRVGFAGALVEVTEPPRRDMPQSKFLKVDALLSRVLQETSKPVLLIFDEFQEAARSAEADAAMAALRSALTQASSRVGVIFSGSSEVLLLQAFSRAKAPLYGFALAQAYPLLKEDFCGHVARKFKEATTRDLPLVEAMGLLEQVGYQPSPFLRVVAGALANPGWTLAQSMKSLLDPKAQTPWSVGWFSLTDLQRMALRLIVDEEQPTAKASLERAAEQLGDGPVQPSSITRALEALEKNGHIQRDLTGSGKRFVVADPMMKAWLKANSNLPVKG
jgi:hypothetical protein